MHTVAAQGARAAGLTVVQGRCILKEHAKRLVTDWWGPSLRCPVSSYYPALKGERR